jgi:glutaredoxin
VLLVKQVKDILLPLENIKKITIYITFGTKHKADLTNKAESIMDLLVDMNVLEDDNFLIVPELTLIASYAKDKAGALIEISCESEKLIIWGKNNCPKCRQLINVLNVHNANYEYKEDIEALIQLSKDTNITQAPIVQIGNKYLTFDEVMRWIKLNPKEIIQSGKEIV